MLSLDENLKYNHLSESYEAVTSCGTMTNMTFSRSMKPYCYVSLLYVVQ